MTGPDSVGHRTVRDYSKVTNESKRPLARAWAGLPLEIWGRLRRGITPEINAVSTIIFLFSLVAIVLWHRLRVRSEGAAEFGAEIVEAVEGHKV